MRKYRTRKKRFYFLLVALFVVSMGLGYAVLTQQLDIDNTVSYDAMKWDVGFYEIDPLRWSIDAVVPTVSISSDKKIVYVSCDFGTSTTSRECAALVAIRNDSTFNVELYANPSFSYNSSLIKNVELNWFYDYESIVGDPNCYEDEVVKGFVMPSGDVEYAVIRVISNDLTVDMLPSSVMSIPISIQLDWQQTEKDAYDTGMSSYEEGNVISIGDEKFNVITSTPTTVTMLSQYNLGTDYRQSESANSVSFSYNNTWEYSPGPKDIDLQTYGGESKTYVNNYVDYLRSETGDSTLSGDLMTLKDLRMLSCTVSDTYAETGGENCLNSPYISWLNNGQNWWIRSAYPNSNRLVWALSGAYFGLIAPEGTGSVAVGVRPVITISKDKLRKYLN